MRKRQLCLMLVSVSRSGPRPTVKKPSNTGSSTPLSLSAGSQITELQQRLKESERQREELSKQLQNADAARESAQLSRLRQENQRLAATQGCTGRPLTRLLTEQQQWFVTGGAVALIALLCGIFASGGQADTVDNG